MSKLIDAAVTSLVPLENARSLEDFKRALPAFTKAQRDIFLALGQNSDMTQEVQREVEVVRKIAIAGGGGDDASLLAAIDELEVAIGNIPAGANLAPLETAVANLRTVADTISSGVGDIETSLSSISTNIGTIDTNLNTVDTNLDAASTKLNEVDTNLDAVNASVTSISNDLDTANSGLTTIQGLLNGMVQDAINAVQAAVDALPEGVDTTALNSAVSTLQGNIDTVSGKVDDVKGVVDTADTKLDGVKTVVDDTETKVDGARVVIDDSKTVIDDTKTVVDTVETMVDDTSTKVTAVQGTVNGIPSNVTDARDHIEQYSNWNVEDGRIGEQPMIVQNGRWLEESSFEVGASVGSFDRPFSDGTTVWVNFSGFDFHAWTIATGARDTDKDFTISNQVIGGTTRYANVRMLYCDGTHVWFPGRESATSQQIRAVFGYRLSTQAYDSSVSVSVLSSQGVFLNDYGITPICDGTHIWRTTDAFFGDARQWPSLEPAPSEDLSIEDFRSLDTPQDYGSFHLRNNIVYAVGRVSDEDPYEVFAFNLSMHGRDSCRDIRTLHDAGNRDPGQIFSTANYLFVADETRDAIYTYELGTKKIGFGRIIL